MKPVVKITHGSNGWGGPLTVCETDTKKVVVSTTGGSKSQPPLQVVVWVGPHKGRLHARPKGRVSQALLLVRL